MGFFLSYAVPGSEHSPQISHQRQCQTNSEWFMSTLNIFKSNSPSFPKIPCWCKHGYEGGCVPGTAPSTLWCSQKHRSKSIGSEEMGRIGHTGHTQGLYLPCTLDGRPLHHQRIIYNLTPVERGIQTPSLPKGHFKHQGKSQSSTRLDQEGTSGQQLPLRGLSNLRKRNRQWCRQWKGPHGHVSPSRTLTAAFFDFTKDTQTGLLQHTTSSIYSSTSWLTMDTMVSFSGAATREGQHLAVYSADNHHVNNINRKYCYPLAHIGSTCTPQVPVGLTSWGFVVFIWGSVCDQQTTAWMRLLHAMNLFLYKSVAVILAFFGLKLSLPYSLIPEITQVVIKLLECMKIIFHLWLKEAQFPKISVHNYW